MMLDPQNDYEKFKSLPPIDEQKAKSLIKGQSEIDKFIKEQRELFYRNEDTDQSVDGGFVSSATDMRKFLGEEFLEVTQQPQHCALNEEDALKERLCEYYPQIFWQMYFHNQFDTEVGNYDVRKRKEYIYNHTRRHSQFLQAIALDDNLKDEHDFWANYIYNVNHYRYKLFYQTIHQKRDLPQQENFFLRLDHYYKWIRHIVDEFVDADFNFNEDVTAGGLTRFYADNRIKTE